jgi:hypothetical protein
MNLESTAGKAALKAPVEGVEAASACLDGVASFDSGIVFEKFDFRQRVSHLALVNNQRLLADAQLFAKRVIFPSHLHDRSVSLPSSNRCSTSTSSTRDIVKATAGETLFVEFVKPQA